MFEQDRWVLYADPRIDTDQRIINLFRTANLLGTIIPQAVPNGFFIANRT